MAYQKSIDNGVTLVALDQPRRYVKKVEKYLLNHEHIDSLTFRLRSGGNSRIVYESDRHEGSVDMRMHFEADNPQSLDADVRAFLNDFSAFQEESTVL